MVLVVAVVIADDLAGDPGFAAPAALFTMPFTVCRHALVASSAVGVEIVVPGPALVLARLVGLPLMFLVPIVLGIQVTAIARVSRWTHTAELAVSVR